MKQFQDNIIHIENTPIAKAIAKSKFENRNRKVYDNDIDHVTWQKNANQGQYPAGSTWKMGIAYGPEGSAS
jgi:hypothetical protein